MDPLTKGWPPAPSNYPQSDLRSWYHQFRGSPKHPRRRLRLSMVLECRRCMSLHQKPLALRTVLLLWRHVSRRQERHHRRAQGGASVALACLVPSLAVTSLALPSVFRFDGQSCLRLGWPFLRLRPRAQTVGPLLQDDALPCMPHCCSRASYHSLWLPKNDVRRVTFGPGVILPSKTHTHISYCRA